MILTCSRPEALRCTGERVILSPRQDVNDGNFGRLGHNVKLAANGKRSAKLETIAATLLRRFRYILSSGKVA